MMMTFMEVKGQQRLNRVNNALWLPNLVRRTADARMMMSYDLHGGQRSTEVKYRKLCSMATKLGQKITDFVDDLHRGQR